jgi:RNA polymerase sigma factor for flagellar operon FliA
MQSLTYGRQDVTYRAPLSVAAEPLAADQLSEADGFVDREEVILGNLPMVRFIARRIHEKLPQYVNLDDLVSAGVLGLIDAANKFDAAKKTQFRTYAQFRIKGAILDSLRDVDWGPRELRRKGRAIEETIRALTAKVGRAPSEQEVADELGQPLAEYQALLGELNGLEMGSLHVQRNDSSGTEEVAYVAGPPEEDPLFICMREELRDRLQAAIEELPMNERLVLTLYYYEELTMREIGLILDVTTSRVSQIRVSAVLHLRAKLEAAKAAVEL